MSDTKGPKYRFRFEAEANGKVGEAVVTVEDVRGKVLYRDKADLDREAERSRVVGTVAQRFRVAAGPLREQFDARWNEERENLRRARDGAAATPGPAAAEPAPVVVTLGDVAAEPVAWLWKPWIPLGMITVLDGDPGLGKSTLTLDLAARVTRGSAMPSGGVRPARPAGVLLMTAEDSLAQTVRPRLDAAGADASRVHALEAVRVGGEERPPVLPYDLQLVEALVAGRGIRLVVVDPFMAFLDGKIDAHRDQDVRRCMHRLKLLAEAFGVAVVLVRHLNKLTGGPALYRGGGSIGIGGAGRSALIVGRHPKEPHLCVLAPNKCNLAPPFRSLAYTYEPVGDVARIGWAGEVDLTAEDILGHPSRMKQTVAAQCVDAIKEALAAGPVETNDLDKHLQVLGHTKRSIERARRELGVRSRRVGFGAEGKWMAELPPEEPGGKDEDEVTDPFPP
jgi:hypothetical protein